MFVGYDYIQYPIPPPGISRTGKTWLKYHRSIHQIHWGCDEDSGGLSPKLRPCRSDAAAPVQHTRHDPDMECDFRVGGTKLTRFRQILRNVERCHLLAGTNQCRTHTHTHTYIYIYTTYIYIYYYIYYDFCTCQLEDVLPWYPLIQTLNCCSLKMSLPTSSSISHSSWLGNPWPCGAWCATGCW